MSISEMNLFLSEAGRRLWRQAADLAAFIGGFFNSWMTAVWAADHDPSRRAK
jgi:hypothetical protein